jgi:imidazolonepropionase-like amidohydrolase
MPERAENIRRLHAAGVEIFAGSDTQSGVFPGPGLHRELANLARAGLSPIEVIRAVLLDGVPIERMPVENPPRK